MNDSPFDAAQQKVKSEFEIRLVREMRAACETMELRDFAELRQIGGSLSGIARVRAAGDGLFDYDDTPFGHWRWITPVCGESLDTPESSDPAKAVACGEPIDLVAWHEASPEDWLLRTGEALWLGAIEEQYLDPRPVQIWRSPLSWMRGKRKGLVPLSRNFLEIHWLLTRCAGDLRAEDEAHAAYLRRVLEHPLPRILVGGVGSHAAGGECRREHRPTAPERTGGVGRVPTGPIV